MKVVTNNGFYITNVSLENIKKINKLSVDFPTPTIDGIIEESISIVGGNRLGKTTFLQAINYVLRNTIDNNQAKLDLDSILTEGTNSGFISISLQSSDEKVDIKSIFTKSINGEVKETIEMITGNGRYKKASDVVKKLNYHYISANTLINLASTPAGIRKLIDYFLYSVDAEIAESYIKLSLAEDKVFKERTPITAQKDNLKAVMEDSELTIKECELLDGHNNSIDELELIDEKIIKLSTSIDRINQNKERVDKLYKELAKCQNDIYNSKNKIETLELTIDKKNNESSIAIERFNGIISELSIYFKDTLITFADLNTVKSKLKNTLDLLNISLSNTADEQLAITKQNEIIKKIEEIDSKIIGDKITELQKEISEDELKELQEEISKAKTVKIAINDKLAISSELINKHKTYLLNKEKYELAKDSWEKKTNFLTKIRLAKEELIYKANIKIDNFEFTPDGVKFKNFDFSEASMAGSERRYVSAQFNIAMNKVVKLAILEEMEALDDNTQLKIEKFAAEEGYVLLTDKVMPYDFIEITRNKIQYGEN